MIDLARQFGMLLSVALLVGPAMAQDLPFDLAEPTLPAEPTTPDELPLPTLDESGTLQEGTSLVVPDGAIEEAPTEPGMTLDSFPGQGPHDDHLQALWDHYPAPIESTGTWLRRGFWYAEADAVVWNRHWNRDDKWFAADSIAVTSPTFFINPVEFVNLNTNRLLVLGGSQPGEDASVRVTLGRFLFRDQRNRDHSAEFTVNGGGDWEQNRVITSADPNGLFVPFILSGNNRSFNLSSRQTLDYGSHYSSFELNYRVKQRMRRDQIVMDPDGCWHRSADSGFSYDYLVGLRMMELRDNLDWRAEDIAVAGSDGIYLVRTDNDLFGFQLGTGMTYETSRWSLGAAGKAGFYVNDALGLTMLDFTDDGDDDDDFNLRLTDDELSAVLEFRLQGKWHLTPNFSLRAAYELMYVTAQALAPNQVNFIPEFATLNTTQDPFYHGASFGFEGYW